MSARQASGSITRQSRCAITDMSANCVLRNSGARPVCWSWNCASDPGSCTTWLSTGGHCCCLETNAVTKSCPKQSPRFCLWQTSRRRRRRWWRWCWSISFTPRPGNCLQASPQSRSWIWQHAGFLPHPRSYGSWRDRPPTPDGLRKPNSVCVPWWKWEETTATTNGSVSIHGLSAATPG